MKNLRSKELSKTISATLLPTMWQHRWSRFLRYSLGIALLASTAWMLLWLSLGRSVGGIQTLTVALSGLTLGLARLGFLPDRPPPSVPRFRRGKLTDIRNPPDFGVALELHNPSSEPWWIDSIRVHARTGELVAVAFGPEEIPAHAVTPLKLPLKLASLEGTVPAPSGQGDAYASEPLAVRDVVNSLGRVDVHLHGPEPHADDVRCVSLVPAHDDADPFDVYGRYLQHEKGEIRLATAGAQHKPGSRTTLDPDTPIATEIGRRNPSAVRAEWAQPREERLQRAMKGEKSED